MSFKLDYTHNTAQSFYYENLQEEDTVSLSNVIARWIINLLIVLGLTYGAIFYLPAYFDIGSTFGFKSSTQSSFPPANSPEFKGKSTEDRSPVQIRKGYMRAGQALKLDYSLSPGTTITVELAECTSPIFINIFNCAPTQKQSIPINGNGPGAKSFIVRTSGFYHFQEIITNADGTPTNAPYMVKWNRKFFKKKKS